MSTENPKSLLRAVFYLNGKNFCLRGGEEHHGLKIRQLKKEREPLCYVYTENASKNRTGGLAQMRVKNRVIKIESVPAAGTRCHVYVLDEYFSKFNHYFSKFNHSQTVPKGLLPLGFWQNLLARIFLGRW